MLGYDEDEAIDRNRVCQHPSCYQQYAHYYAHFYASCSNDFEGSVQLSCKDGSLLPFYFVSRALSGFSASGNPVLTVLSPVNSSRPVAKKSSLPAQHTSEELLSKYHSLDKLKQQTLKYVAMGRKYEWIADTIGRDYWTVVSYVKQMKELFEVGSLAELTSTYRLCSRYRPVKKAQADYNKL